MEKGATHYTHWFQPLTGSTAEKHDSFYAPTGDGTAIAEFSGKELIQGEPDASSFPTGGIRATFEARGYTAWDPTSPAFILENPNGALLCIPTAFASWTGEALDHKIPLLRSMDALSTVGDPRAAAVRRRGRPQRVFTTVGPEQEYFLIDEQYYFERPDLFTTGRTLFGAKPPKGHELDDHYFGSIPERVLACMLETERELRQARRADQDAPQRGRARPVRDRADLRELERRLRPPAADDAGACRTSPAATGSSACCTRSRSPASTARASTTTGRWAPTPGTTCSSRATRRTRTCSSCSSARPSSQAVNKHQALLRASVANVGQDHRLGANEAPPAIISIFLGAELEKVVRGDRVGRGRRGDAGLVPRPRHAGAAAAADARRRPQPDLAVRLHRQQVRVPRARARACRSALPNTVLNTIVAEAIDELADKLEARRSSGGTTLDEAVARGRQGRLRSQQAGSSSTATTTPRSGTRRPRSAGWPTCARRRTRCRGWSRSRRSRCSSDYDVLSERELESRYEVVRRAVRRSKLNIEAETAASIARTMLLPAAVRHLAELKAAGHRRRWSPRAEALIDELVDGDRRAREGQRRPPGRVRASSSRSTCATRSSRRWTPSARSPTSSSGIVADDLWPLPKYSEMLFIK